MAITGAPDIEIGGEVSSGPTPGDYRVEVTDAQLSIPEAEDKYPQLVLELTVRGDANHPAKEGKRLSRIKQSMPKAGDPEDKRKSMKGILKRLCFEGFGVPWPEKAGSKFDPRVFMNKTAFVRIAPRTSDRGTFNDVVAVAQSLEALPTPRGAKSTAPAETNGRAGGRRR